MLSERPQRHVDSAQLDHGLGDEFEALLLVVGHLVSQLTHLPRTHVAVRRGGQRRDLPLFARQLDDMLKHLCGQSASTCPACRREEANIIVVRPKRVALEGVDSVMELLSADEGPAPVLAYKVLGGEDCRGRSGFQLGAVRVLRWLGAASSVLGISTLGRKVVCESCRVKEDSRMDTRRKDSCESRNFPILFDGEDHLVHERIVHPSLAADEIEVVDVWHGTPAVQGVIHGVVARIERLGHDSRQAVNGLWVGARDLADGRGVDRHVGSGWSVLGARRECVRMVATVGQPVRGPRCSLRGAV